MRLDTALPVVSAVSRPIHSGSFRCRHRIRPGGVAPLISVTPASRSVAWVRYTTRLPSRLICGDWDALSPGRRGVARGVAHQHRRRSASRQIAQVDIVHVVRVDIRDARHQVGLARLEESDPLAVRADRWIVRVSVSAFGCRNRSGLTSRISPVRRSQR